MLLKFALKEYISNITDKTKVLFYDTTDVEEKREYLKTIRSYHKSVLGFDSLDIKESFILYLLPMIGNGASCFVHKHNLNIWCQC